MRQVEDIGVELPLGDLNLVLVLVTRLTGSREQAICETTHPVLMKCLLHLRVFVEPVLVVYDFDLKWNDS